MKLAFIAYYRRYFLSIRQKLKSFHFYFLKSRGICITFLAGCQYHQIEKGAGHTAPFLFYSNGSANFKPPPYTLRWEHRCKSGYDRHRHHLHDAP